MPFSVKDWKDYPDTSTPITQAALEDMETRLSTYTTQRTSVSVVEYGADPTGATSSTTAIQNAINACASAGGGEVFIPAGTYKLTSGLTWGDRVSMRGAGTRATKLSYTGSGHAITFGDGTITTASTGYPDSLYTGLSIRDLYIIGTSSGLSGIRVRGCTRWEIARCLITGFSNGAGILINGLSFIGHIRGGRIVTCAKGISAKKVSADGSAGEGQAANAIEISGQMEIQQCGVGIELGDPATTETTPIVGQQIEIHSVTVEGCTTGGVWNVSAYNVNVHDNYFEGNANFDVRVGSTDGNTLIPLLCNVANNFMYGATSHKFVELLRGYQPIVERNLIRGSSSGTNPAFTVGAAVEDAYIADNWTDTVSADLSDAGARTVYLENPRPFVKSTHNTTQSIGNASWTTVTFNTDSSDYYDQHTAGQPTRFVAPSLGYYQLNAQITFAGNSTGLRAVRVLDQAAAQAAATWVQPASSDDTVISLTTPPTRLAKDDYLYVQVYQSSGGSLNVSSYPVIVMHKVEL